VLEASPPPDVDTRLAALELDGRAADFLCERDAAEAAWARQAAEAEAAGRVQAQLRAAVHLGKVEIFAGRPPDRLHRAVALAREAGAVAELAWALENLGVGLAIHGDLPASIQVLDEAVGLCRQLRLDNLAYLLTHQAMGRSHVGGDCETGLDEAEALLPTDDLRLHSCSVRADIAMRAGQYDAATRWFVEVVDIMRRMPGVVPMDGPCWLVWALIGAGRRDDATAAIADARRMPDLERWYTRPVLLDAAEAVLAGDADGFNRILRDGAQSMPWDAALMREVAAAAFPAPARAAWLAEALEIYDRLGATIDADRVRAALRDAGGKVPRRRRPRQPVPAALAAAGVTGREFEVLRLLGEGLPNADIAARLYVSVRTVESHVSSLLTKLDARNRGQLIARSAAIRDP
jgi:DNA-binding CsgD family transcriptional regulator